MKTETETMVSYHPKKPIVSYIMYRNDKIRCLNKKEEYKNISLFEINKMISQMWKQEESFVKEFYQHKYSVKQANYFKQKETFEKKQTDFIQRNKKITKKKKLSFIIDKVIFQIEKKKIEKTSKNTLLVTKKTNRQKCDICKECTAHSDPVLKNLSFLKKKKVNLLYFFGMVNKDFVIKLVRDEKSGKLTCL